MKKKKKAKEKDVLISQKIKHNKKTFFLQKAFYHILFLS